MRGIPNAWARRRARTRAILVVLVVAGSLLATGTAEAGARCFGRAPTIVGTRGDDLIVGTAGDDVIHGLRGFDRIRASVATTASAAAGERLHARRRGRRRDRRGRRVRYGPRWTRRRPDRPRRRRGRGAVRRAGRRSAVRRKRIVRRPDRRCRGRPAARRPRAGPRRVLRRAERCHGRPGGRHRDGHGTDRLVAIEGSSVRTSTTSCSATASRTCWWPRRATTSSTPAARGRSRSSGPI